MNYRTICTTLDMENALTLYIGEGGESGRYEDEFSLDIHSNDIVNTEHKDVLKEENLHKRGSNRRR